MGVRQPEVHGRKTSLGAVADHHEDKADPDDTRVERGSDLHDSRPAHRARASHDVGGSGIDEHRAEESEGDADGRHDDVLPRRLQAVLVPVVANEDGRGYRRPLHRDPEESEVVGEDRHDHRRDEGVYESEVGSQGLDLHIADLHRLPEPPHRIDGDSQSEGDEKEEKDEPKVVHADDAERLRAASCDLAGEDEREREEDRRATDVDGREDAAVARREHEQRSDGRDERQDPEERFSHGSSPQPVQVRDVGVDRRSNPQHQDCHNERGEDDIENHADFDDERHALRHRHRCEEDPVLGREEAHHLSQRRLTSRHDQHAEQGDADTDGKRVAGNRLADGAE